MRGPLFAVAMALLPGTAVALDCTETTFDQVGFTVCKVEPERDQLRLFLRDKATERPLGSFRNVERQLEDGQTLAFAMNAGMYHADRSPVGHYVEDGTETAPVITADGPGNFGLLPNGVFCIGDAYALVVETKRFAREAPECLHATQSGPMLVIDGKLHPRFLEHSDSLHIRNGVGTTADGRTAWFAISNRPVNFHTFGRFFRDHISVDQALYFDGKISRLYAPEMGRRDGGFPMGPIVGVVTEAE